MRNDGGGFGGYVWGALTGFFTALSAQDVMFGLGALVTALLGLLTYISNDRRNKRIAAAAEARNVILQRYIDTRQGDKGEIDAQALDTIQELDA